MSCGLSRWLGVVGRGEVGSAESVQWESKTGECWMSRRGRWRGGRRSSGRAAK